jgi:outer membrane receptor protein involved in Fe transport
LKRFFTFTYNTFQASFAWKNFSFSKYSLLILFVCISSIGFAQQSKGSIVGLIQDKEVNEEPLPFANILIKGTSKGTTSDYDGLYSLDNLEPGSYTLVFSFLGYESLEVPNVNVIADKVTEINVALGASAAALDEVVISTVSRKDSEVALLLEQKKAVAIKTAIGSAELARKGVGNAESAVTKVSGVSKQEGVKNVFVRGLGDRYNSSTLNGLPLPSEDPEYKNIALDFFSSDIINSVGISKTFDAEIYGDVAGANIDIVSKELYGKDDLRIKIGSGFNTRAVNQQFLTVDGAKPLGFGIDKNVPITSLGTYDFKNSYGPNSQNLQLNNSVSLQLGKKFAFNNNDSFSALIIGSLDNRYVYQNGNTKVINAQGLPLRDLKFSKYNYNVSQILMGNFVYRFDEKGFITYNSLYIHNNTQAVGDYTGQSANISEEEGDSAFIRRQQVNNNNLFVNQLLFDFKISKRLGLNVDAGYNLTRGNEPDRRQNTYVFDGNNYEVATGTPSYNHRFFSDLSEDEVTGKAYLDYKIGEDSDNIPKKGNLRIGYNFRKTDRNFNFLQFNHDFPSPTVVDIDNPDGLFNQENLSNGTFRLVTNNGFSSDFDPLTPFFYEGQKTVHAGFAQFLYSFTDKLSAIAGIRYENVNQYVNWNTNLSSSEFDLNVDPSTLKKNYFLPSINLKYSIIESSIFRLAGSKTYTFPQFKEVAPFLYEDVNFASFGNPGLKPSDNYNVDIKYEYYLSSDEIISLTGFYKRIINPINRIQVNSAANQLSYINSGNKADVAGAELEIRKNIFDKESDNGETQNNLSAGLNASYLYSKQDLSDPSTNFTNEHDQLEGASPLLLNSDLTYRLKKSNSDITASAVLNYFSDRIYSIGVQQKGNIVETGISTLDFVLRSELGNHLGLNFAAKNVLDPNLELTQKDVNGNKIVINNFKKGIIFSLGINYKF